MIPFTHNTRVDLRASWEGAGKELGSSWEASGRMIIELRSSCFNGQDFKRVTSTPPGQRRSLVLRRVCAGVWPDKGQVLFLIDCLRGSGACVCLCMARQRRSLVCEATHTQAYAQPSALFCFTLLYSSANQSKLSLVLCVFMTCLRDVCA